VTRAVALRILDLCHLPQDILTLNLHPLTSAKLFYLHQLFHPNSQALCYFVKIHLQPTSEDLSFLKSITASCKICEMSNSNSRYSSTPFPTHQARGSLPGTDWQLDLTHMPTVRHAKYLLVLVETFLWWVEAFPTTNKRAQTVSDLLLQEIIPQFRIPASLQSDNGPKFTSQVSQILSKALDIPLAFSHSLPPSTFR
jgi:transposase InsO family protein